MGNDVNETNGNNKRRAKNERCGNDHAMKIAKTHKETDIGDDKEEEQGRQMVDGGKDIKAREERQEGNRGTPREGHDRGQRERQVVSGGEDTQARKRPEEEHRGNGEK